MPLIIIVTLILSVLSSLFSLDLSLKAETTWALWSWVIILGISAAFLGAVFFMNSYEKKLLIGVKNSRYARRIQENLRYSIRSIVKYYLQFVVAFVLSLWLKTPLVSLAVAVDQFSISIPWRVDFFAYLLAVSLLLFIAINIKALFSLKASLTSKLSEEKELKEKLGIDILVEKG